MRERALPQVVILAGGLGTRLGAVTASLPKPMVPVAGKPFLEYVIAQLARQQFRRILLLAGFRAEVIREHFGDGSRFGVEIDYSIEPEPLGTGGAIRFAASNVDDRFLLMYGDLYRELDYAAFCDAHRERSCLAIYEYVAGLTTIACGNVALADRQVVAYRKNRPDLAFPYVDAGFGVMTREAVALLPAGASSFEERVYDALATRGRLEGEVVDREFFDIGNPADLERTRATFAR
jgi:D-glycero-D-manno-heptose 1,7-bisphosphate phosphatase